MSNITFLQYTPHQEKKRVLNTNACLHCRKAHTACTSHRPCDRCVRMNVDCISSSAPTNKKKKEELIANEKKNTIDVESVSQFLFSDTPTPQQFNFNNNNNNNTNNTNTNFNSSSFVPTTNNIENPFNFIQPTSFLPIENIPVYDAPSPSLSSPSPSSFSLPSPSVQSSSSSSSSPSESPMQFVPEDCCGDAEDNYIDNHTMTQNNNATIQFSTYINASGSDNIVSNFTQNYNNNNNMSNDPRIDELIAQNKRMEMRLSSLSRQVDYLQTKMDPNIVTSSSSMLPATATWKLPSCELLECNKTFMELLGFNDNDSEIKLITFFQLGACTKAIGKVQKRIETAIRSGVSLQEPPHTKTMALPIFKKNREVIVMNLTAIVYLDSPEPVLTTVLRNTH